MLIEEGSGFRLKKVIVLSLVSLSGLVLTPRPAFSNFFLSATAVRLCLVRLFQTSSKVFCLPGDKV